MQIEAQFRNNGITADQTKYDIVVGSIEAENLAHVTDILTRSPSSGKYDAIKERLISVFADSETQRTQKLLTELELGDRKPSQLLCEMRNLADDQIGEHFLKTLWFQRLPVDMKSILSVSTDDLPKLATKADRIWELKPDRYQTQMNIASTSKQEAGNQIAALQRQVDELTTQIAELRRERSHTREKQRQRNRSTSRDQTICYYHWKFGDKARKCLQPCNYQTMEDRTKGALN